MGSILPPSLSVRQRRRRQRHPRKPPLVEKSTGVDRFPFFVYEIDSYVWVSGREAYSCCLTLDDIERPDTAVPKRRNRRCLARPEDSWTRPVSALYVC